MFGRCTAWYGYDCHAAVSEYDYTRRAQAALIAACPAVCRVCVAHLDHLVRHFPAPRYQRRLLAGAEAEAEAEEEVEAEAEKEVETEASDPAEVGACAGGAIRSHRAFAWLGGVGAGVLLTTILSQPAHLFGRRELPLLQSLLWSMLPLGAVVGDMMAEAAIAFDANGAAVVTASGGAAGLLLVGLALSAGTLLLCVYLGAELRSATYRSELSVHAAEAEAAARQAEPQVAGAPPGTLLDSVHVVREVTDAKGFRRLDTARTLMI